MQNLSCTYKLYGYNIYFWEMCNHQDLPLPEHLADADENVDILVSSITILWIVKQITHSHVAFENATIQSMTKG